MNRNWNIALNRFDVTWTWGRAQGTWSRGCGLESRNAARLSCDYHIPLRWVEALNERDESKLHEPTKQMRLKWSSLTRRGELLLRFFHHFQRFSLWSVFTVVILKLKPRVRVQIAANVFFIRLIDTYNCLFWSKVRLILPILDKTFFFQYKAEVLLP